MAHIYLYILTYTHILYTYTRSWGKRHHDKMIVCDRACFHSINIVTRMIVNFLIGAVIFIITMIEWMQLMIVIVKVVLSGVSWSRGVGVVGRNG